MRMTVDTDRSERWSGCVTVRGAGPAGSCLVGVFEGEGIGPEVVAAARRVAQALEASGGPRIVWRLGGMIGAEAEAAHGVALTPEAGDFCREIFAAGGAVLHGPGGGRFVYELRRRFDLYCKIAPVAVFPEFVHGSCFQPQHLGAVDWLVVRDNSGGVYQGASRESVDPKNGRVVEHTFSYSESQVRRILGVAARLAARRRGRLTVVVKEGGMPEMSNLWRECAWQAASQAGLEVRMLNIDHAAYEVIRNPGDFDVLCTPNMFGDILIDLAALLAGGRGLGFSGNFSSSAAVYQTNHGAAHALAGRDEANPLGQILSLGMLLAESFGREDCRRRIDEAIRAVWRQGWRTADMAEPGCRLAGTRRMGELVAEAVAAG